MECDINNIVNAPAHPTQCHPCLNTIINCMNCTSPVNCVLCISGWGTNGPHCILCSSAITSCVNCTNTTKCVTCIHGWIPDGSRCIRCQDVIFHCLICTNQTTCINCMVGWPVAGGCTNVSQCLSVVQNYSINTSICIACSPTFILNSSLCSCPSGYWGVVMTYCTNIIGGITTRLISSQAICSAYGPSSKL